MTSPLEVVGVSRRLGLVDLDLDSACSGFNQKPVSAEVLDHPSRHLSTNHVPGIVRTNSGQIHRDSPFGEVARYGQLVKTICFVVSDSSGEATHFSTGAERRSAIARVSMDTRIPTLRGLARKQVASRA